MADQTLQLGPVASGSLSVVAVGSYTVLIQRLNNLVKITFCNRVTKSADPRTNPNPKPPCTLHDHSQILGLPARRYPRIFATHCFALNEYATCDTPTTFNDASTPLQNGKNYRSLGRAKFLKQQEYVISGIVY